MPKNPKQPVHKPRTGFVWMILFPKIIFNYYNHTSPTFPAAKWIRSADQNTRPFPEPSPIPAEATAGSTGAAVLVQELGSWLEQPSTGETARLRNNRSMEGRRGLSRLTGQNAEPPWGVKLILLGSGQEEMTAGFSFCTVLEKEKQTNKRGL